MTNAKNKTIIQSQTSDATATSVIQKIGATEVYEVTATTLDVKTKKISNVVDPTADQDAATKKYVDDNSGGSGAGIYQSTVGATGADYTTLGAAVAAGKTRILVIANTTETGDVTLLANTLLSGYGIDSGKVNMDSNTLKTSNYNILSNTAIIGEVSVEGVDNSLTNLKVGATAGSGTNTITVTDVANTIIIGCRTDADIVDGGTDTVIVGNVTY